VHAARGVVEDREDAFGVARDDGILDGIEERVYEPPLLF
jgi:hypothetical protein